VAIPRVRGAYRLLESTTQVSLVFFGFLSLLQLVLPLLGLIWYLLWAKKNHSIMQVARLSRVAIRGVTSRAMSTYTTTNFINGKFVESAGTEVYPLHNPVSDGENIFTINHFISTLHLSSRTAPARPPARPLASHHASPRCPMFTPACDATPVALWGGCDGSVSTNSQF
jgi:hypothetical protein